MTLRGLQLVLGGAGIGDILVVGFLDDSEQPMRFYALYRTLYFECDGVLIKFSVIGDTGRMQITQAQTVAFDAELDDDLQWVCSSVRLAVLHDPDGSNLLATVHLWDARDGATGIDCAAARFDLANGQHLFLDPSYHFGIRLGGAEQQSIWMENSPQAADAHVAIGLAKNEG